MQLLRKRLVRAGGSITTLRHDGCFMVIVRQHNFDEAIFIALGIIAYLDGLQAQE